MISFVWSKQAHSDGLNKLIVIVLDYQRNNCIERVTSSNMGPENITDIKQGSFISDG